MLISSGIILASNVTKSILSGKDPSLTSIITPLAISNIASIPNSLPISDGECVLNERYLGTLPSESLYNQENVVVQKYVDSKYITNGNLEDAWENLKDGELTFHSFALALVDIVDMLTGRILQPQLLEIKLNPHLKARQLHHTTEIQFDESETEKQNEITSNGIEDKKVSTNRKITQISKISIEISPEDFEKATLSSAENVAKIQDLNLANKTIISSKLDISTTTKTKVQSTEPDQKITNSTSERTQTIESTQDLLHSNKNDIDTIKNNGGILTNDKETIHTEITQKSTANSIRPEESALANSTNLNETSAERNVEATGVQVKEIDHLTGHSKVIQSGIREDIAFSQKGNLSDGNSSWLRKGSRTRISVGSNDITKLNTISIDNSLQNGATLQIDKSKSETELKQNTTSNSIRPEESTLANSTNLNETSAERNVETTGVQVEEIDHLTGSKVIKSEMHESITFSQSGNLSDGNSNWLREGSRTRISVGSSDITKLDNLSVDASTNSGSNLVLDHGKTKDSAKITKTTRENPIEQHSSNIEKEEFWYRPDIIKTTDLDTTTIKQLEKTREGFTETEHNYLTNESTVLENKLGEHERTTSTIEETKNTTASHEIFGKNTKKWLGENIKTDKTLKEINKETLHEIKSKVHIFDAIDDSKSELLTKGAEFNVINSSQKTNLIDQTSTASFNDGLIDWVPAVGSSIHLASKASLGAEVSFSDVAWAALDVSSSVATLGAGSAFSTLGKTTIKAGLKGIAKDYGKGLVKQTFKATTTELDSIAKQSGNLLTKNFSTKNFGTKLDRVVTLPKNNGTWQGKMGNSNWLPDKTFKPKKFNPDNKSFQEICKENNLDNGIPFKNGDINLKPASKASIKIKDFTTMRAKNFSQADSKLANNYTKNKVDGHSWEKGDITKLRKEQNLTWHECSDRKTLELVPRELHENIPHRGGISIAKSKMEQEISNKIVSETKEELRDQVIGNIIEGVESNF